ncbi:lipid A core--O-antigen ligase [Scytonema hofmannii PCC 7110]|uniref:Lipid A core--O-antigen ligase n=1 Tax=Scytonema hofmannii PCC 7110 TaxID=128403 RepID=A0A139XA58_9CYAN|nr:O-antigen ligase family protein [Scytonema hofmannii]KYC41556.1 lipid A core--O-antigen ligase [Scytonema hofmannii PCC 7110]
MNLYKTLLSLTLILSGLTDLTRKFSFGPISSQGVLTILLAGASWFLVLSRSRMPKAVLSTSCLVLFILSNLIIWFWFSSKSSLPIVNAIQNQAVFLAFVGFTILSITQSYRTFDPPEYISHTFTRAAQISVGLYGLSIVLGGPGTSSIMGARSFALFAIIGLAWFLAWWRYRLPGGFLWSISTTIAIAFSFSRTAAIICLILFPLSQISLTTIKGWVRLIATICLIITVSYLAFTFVEPIRARFTDVGDNATVGGVKINTAGRGAAWPIAYESALQSPWIGKGPGSVTIALKAAGPAFDHPHNDYLRIFHDYGLIGTLLWFLGYFGLMAKTWQNWQWADRNDRTVAHIHLAAFLALVAVALGMLSDNVVVYIFSMNPLGILVGASIGNGSRRRKEINSDRDWSLVSGNLGKLVT